jgi:hypothetical protein
MSGAHDYFVSNMDEMGRQDSGENDPIVFYVPVEDEQYLLRFPVSRTGKQMALSFVLLRMEAI